MQLWLLRLLWQQSAGEAHRATIYPTRRFKQGCGCHFVVYISEYWSLNFLYVFANLSGKDNNDCIAYHNTLQ